MRICGYVDSFESQEKSGPVSLWAEKSSILSAET